MASHPTLGTTSVATGLPSSAQGRRPRRRAYETAYAARRRSLLAYGRWSPTPLLDPYEAREHVATLQRYGLSLETIASQGHVSASLLAALVYPSHQRWGARLTPATLQRLMAVRFDLATLPEHRHVNATGTTRRLQALAVLGWPLSALGAELGVSAQAIAGYRSRPTVSVATARAVRDLFERHGMTPGPSPRTTHAALRAGWVPPLAWDEDDIDDPAAAPNPDPDAGTAPSLDEVAIRRACAGDAVALTPAERRQAASILACQGLSDTEVAHRLGVCSRTILRWRHAGTPTDVGGRGGRDGNGAADAKADIA